MKLGLLFILFFITAISHTSNSLADDDILFSEIAESIGNSGKKKEYLYFSNHELFSDFDTITYLLPNNEDQIFDEIFEGFYQFSNAINNKNGATILDKGYTERNILLLKGSSCLKEINYNKLGSILFHIKETKKCYSFSFENMVGFLDLITAFTSITGDLDKKNVNHAILEQRIKEVVDHYANKNNVPDNVIELVKQLLNDGLNKALSYL